MSETETWVLWGYVGGYLWRLEVGPLKRCRAAYNRRTKDGSAADMIMRKLGQPYRFDIDAPLSLVDGDDRGTFSECFTGTDTPEGRYIAASTPEINEFRANWARATIGATS